MASNNFYVYEHWRPDKDQCFYVGKGKDNRAYVERPYNKHYTSVLKKLARLGMCVEVRMVESGLCEREAFALEKVRIAFWRTLGISLTNLTDGGEGCAGRTFTIQTINKIKDARRRQRIEHSDETKAKIGAKHKGKVIPLHQREAVSRSNKTRGISEATRLKMSQVRVGKKLGPCSEETKRKIGTANRNPSEQTRAKMRAAKLGKKLAPEHRDKIVASLIGRSVSKETREKLSTAMKSRCAKLALAVTN